MPADGLRSARPRSSRGITTAATLVALLLLTPAPASATPSQRVGLPVVLNDLYIPGGEARPAPRSNSEAPLVVRLLAVKPAQDGQRYDLEVYGLEPGDYDLADFLEAADPARPPRFPEIPLTITTELPPGLPRPQKLAASPPGHIGGYRTLLRIMGAVWVLGLLALVFWRKRRAASARREAPPPTLAERLRTLVTAASRSSLDADQQAALERLILGHWRQRLPELADLPPAEGLATLRRHQEAGPLLLQLEEWLHSPRSNPSPDEIDQLLAPYAPKTED